MFNKPLVISLSIFLIFMIYTSSVKHKTRNLEKKINNLNSEIGVLKKQLKDAKTDYVFLSSPEQLKKYLITLNINDFSIYDVSRIFHSTDQFIIYNDKQTRLLNLKSKWKKYQKIKTKGVFILMNITKIYLMRKKIII